MSEQKKYYTVEEAAEILGISPAEVNQRRERNEIHGFRDAGSWKFKVEDVEKLRKPRGSGAPAEEGDVLLSEAEVGPSGAKSGTVIGPTVPGRSPSDSDIRLADSDIKLAGSDLPSGEAKVASTGSDIRIADSDIKLSGSDLLDMAGSDVDKARAKAADFEDLDITIEQDLTLEDSDQVKREDSHQLAATDDSAQIVITAKDDSKEVAPKKGSAIGKKTAAQKPAAEEDDTASDDSDAVSGKDKGLDDDDVVLGGGSSGSDVTIGGDSGISLVDPADSGLSLEEPLELAGAEDDSLELGEDDMLALADSADTEAPTELKADDEFLLTPLEEASEEDSESGSQVIALDTGPAGDASPTLAGARSGGVAAMLDEDFSGAGAGLGVAAAPAAAAVAAAPVGVHPAFAEGGMPMPVGAMAAALPETPYSVGQIVFLASCVVLLILSGFMTYDLLRNQWSWSGPYPINSSLMQSLVNAIGF